MCERYLEQGLYSSGVPRGGCKPQAALAAALDSSCEIR